jgi:signal transduction histidine kinase
MVVDQHAADRLAETGWDVPRVLVVDDEEPVRVTIQGVLELDGYDVSTAGSAEHALDLLRSEAFDVVLTDLRLEAGIDGIDGIDLLRELRERSPHAVSIMLTGYGSLESAVKALREGAYDYLLKPCDVLELRMTVSRGLEQTRMAAQVNRHVSELELANETIRALNLELEERVERATSELRDQIDARDEFMSTLSHDLKTPLTFIKGIAALRRRRAVVSAETAPLVDALEQIDASAGRMALQLDELVDASRLQAGRPVELRLARVDLVALACKAVAEHQKTSDRHVLRVTTTLSELVGLWDEVRLGRVLDSLLDNALTYSPRGGAVEVTITTDRQQAALRVTDRGEGIPVADQPHLFERPRRGSNAEGRIPGTGIGLAGVRAIVELHHGSIGVQSEVGQGTTFTIRLPLDPAAV